MLLVTTCGMGSSAPPGCFALSALSALLAAHAAHTTPRSTVLFDSVPHEVNMISSGRPAPTMSATRCRASRIASRQHRPITWPLLGLPKW